MKTVNNQSLNGDDMTARKGAHIRLSLDDRSQCDFSVFNQYRLPYMALPEIALVDVDSSFNLFGMLINAPLIIGSMTGGTEHGLSINTNLAIAAEQCGVALALGSQRIGLESYDARETFKVVRKNAPNACVIANMGAVQLNYGHGIDSYREVIDMVQANALYLHINPLQEALQPGGDSDFRGLLSKIEELVRVTNVPIFVKEVGNGINGVIAEALFDVGVRGVDVAGVGGTSYSWIEAERDQNEDFKKWFKTYGIPSDLAIIQAAAAKKHSDQLIIASGGIRSPIDGLKAHALGADLFSAAVPFLAPAIESVEKVIQQLDNWKRGLKIAMFASGAINWKAAKNLELTASQELTN